MAMSHLDDHSWSRKPGEATRATEFHAWQGQPYDQRGSSASPGRSTGYVSCQFAPYNYFIRFWSISFISLSFVAKHSLPIATMKHTMLVSSPGGEMRTKHICPAVSITIREVDFPSNLILLDSKGIDIILGMDWLSKYDRVIQCTRKAVKLTKKDRTSVEFVAIVQSGPDGKLNQTKAIALEDIRVVHDFPDIFPEELPGILPDRDIEFLIELLPRTPPISKRPYRMPMNELVELKKQIAELQAKGFIRPSSSPGEHPYYLWKRRTELNGCALITDH
jgi:hypothetical protein